MMDLHALDGCIQVKWLKCWSHLSNILFIIHPVVFLVLPSVHIRNGPIDLVPHGFGLLELDILDLFLLDIQSLQISLIGG